MKRSPLKRKKPLQAKKSLQAHSTLKQHKSMSKKRSVRAKSKDFTAETKRIVFERSNGRCERCRVRPLMEYHHCIFRSAGDACTNDLSNCLGLCIWCHKEDPDSAHKSRKTREWCVFEAKRLAGVNIC